MAKDDSNTLLVEHLTQRLTAPGVLNLRRLQRWRERLYRSLILRGLVERLQLRMGLFANAEGEAMVWARGAREITAASESLTAPILPMSAASAMSAAFATSGTSSLDFSSSAGPASTAQHTTSAPVEQISPIAARMHARLNSPRLTRAGDLHAQRPSTTTGLIDTARLAMPLQARAGVTSIVASTDRLASDTTQLMPASNSQRAAQRPTATEVSETSGTGGASQEGGTRTASGTVFGNVSVQETSTHAASLAMPTAPPRSIGSRSPNRSRNDFFSNGNSRSGEIAHGVSVVPMMRTPATQAAHSSLPLAVERVPNSGTPHPVLLFRKPAAAPVQPQQMQDATQYRSGDFAHPPGGATSSLQHNFAPVQVEPHFVPAHTGSNVGWIAGIADQVERLLQRRLEIDARRRGRSWR